MSRRTTFTRLGIGAAGTALAALAASAAPALAAPYPSAPAHSAPVQASDGWGDDGGGEGGGDGGGDDGGGSSWNGGGDEGGGNDGRSDGRSDGREDHHQRLTKGRVTARDGLLLRDAPTRGSRPIRTEPFNAIVTIFCKTRGGDVRGEREGERERTWYLLTDGTWAWGSARFIETFGKSPRSC
ncbi:SH3 domain-containing protein [Streptomyces antnestii]|uniref:SH3 domain-containing protein n=1 Tax=Streptomyces antnestii TaxID=2494256 RepID=A0A3S2VT28_9ACTN|nr:SH3 domain-containing protein [Streptomyces sp. San01]RVU20359.1 SH3 domain-containing protein [Streptomyces sp. San01]